MAAVLTRGRRGGASRDTAPSRGIFKVPARIMAPRIILFVAAFGLTLFGLLMIFSASSVTSLTSSSTDYDAAYYFMRQLRAIVAGTVLLVGLYFIDYRRWRGIRLVVAWLVTLALLIAIFSPVAGSDAYGATRWISVAGFTLQPAEFAKVTLILVGADIFVRYFEEGSIGGWRFAALLCAGIGIPLLLILLQPDKGTTGILFVTLAVMGYIAGVRTWVILGGFGVGAAAAAFLAMSDDYSRARVLTMLNPFRDPYGAGWQLVQGFYAFGSGGLTGVGIGLSRQKYSYLPMAYNDFIYAVIGEETGLVGTVGVLVAFALLIWAGLKIAEQAPDLRGRLVAAGCSTLIGVQLLVNVCGVIGFFPLSGKPVPFLSYGGSSIMSCLMLVGLIASVSRRSTLPDTVYDRRRGSLRLAGEEDGRGRADWDDGLAWGASGLGVSTWQDDDLSDPGLSSAGQATPRSSRLRLAGGGRDDGSATVPRVRGSSGADAQPSYGGTRTTPRPLSPANPRKNAGRSGSWQRTDLNDDAADRLRLHDDTGRSGTHGRRDRRR